MVSGPLYIGTDRLSADVMLFEWVLFERILSGIVSAGTGSCLKVMESAGVTLFFLFKESVAGTAANTIMKAEMTKNISILILTAAKLLINHRIICGFE